MKKVTMMVSSSREIAKDTIELVLENDYVSRKAKPGQFLHIAVPGHTLRRPISIAAVNGRNNTITILFKVVGSGTNQLSRYTKGMSLDVLGPNGNGFPLPDTTAGSSILLIGGGIGIPPLYFLASHLCKMGFKIQAILGYQQKDFVFYEHAFEEIADTYVVTNDGSYGYKGYVTDMLDDVREFDLYYTCGPKAMLRAVHKALPGKDGYLSFEERMGCGIGACYACVIPTKGAAGSKKICQDGPVFSAKEVIL